jgi:hypothetical protein
MRLCTSSLLWFSIAALAAAPAGAWGDEGHRVTALLAYRHLTPQARAAVDELLAADSDPLTRPDFAGRATWADKYRSSHRETSEWHFVDIEIDHPDLEGACHGFPGLLEHQPASQGPAADCVVNKIEEFAVELNNPATPPAERLLALKFLIHFVADLHQPLHAADHLDRGGNCIGLSAPPGGHANLHAYWDVAVVEALGKSAADIADKLDAGISMTDMKDWTAGTPRSWAMESFEVARRDVYSIGARPTCQTGGSVALSADYEVQARNDAAIQLSKAAIRLASLLNWALAR